MGARGRVAWALVVLACCAVAAADLRPTSKHVTLSETRLRAFSQRSTADAIWPLLRPLLIPRVVGTPGHAAARKYIIEHFRKLGGWTIDVDEFEDDTPLGRKRFGNIVATLDANATRRLTLAAHYDSKFFPSGAFVGATDSAVPCAMLLFVALRFDAELKAYARRARTEGGPTLQFIFFDGEEAFVEWSDSDSLYGSRHLAQEMASARVGGSNVTALSAIDVLVLLDLIGAGGGQFFSAYDKTAPIHDRFVSAERRLRATGLLVNANRLYFRPSAGGAPGEVADDHLPFLHRGVPVVHVIQRPFPPTWHTMGDSERGLERDHVVDMTAIVAVFVAEYLGLR